MDPSGSVYKLHALGLLTINSIDQSRTLHIHELCDELTHLLQENIVITDYFKDRFTSHLEMQKLQYRVRCA